MKISEIKFGFNKRNATKTIAEEKFISKKDYKEIGLASDVFVESQKIPSDYVFLAIYQGEIIAKIYFEANIFTNVLVIELVYVLEEFRNKGVGTALMKNFIKMAEDSLASYSYIQLKTNQHKYKFYEKLGFETKIIYKNYGIKYCKNIDHYILTKKIKKR